MARLFGTDGVRGVAGTELTEDLAFRLGRAAVVVLGRHGAEPPTFVVGRDPRASGEWLEDALVAGVRAGGGDVVVAGVQTTPAVAFFTVELQASSGVVISASHNPPEYNGIKFFGSNGMKLSDDLEDEIEAALEVHDVKRQGSVLALGKAGGRYIDHIVACAEAPLDGMTIAVDCANGAASGVAADAYRRLGAEVRGIFDHPDGVNINDGCGALHPDVVAAEVLRVGADAGVAHDGDADRAIFADELGNVVDGDKVLAACALALHEEGRLSGDRVVATPMANLGFRRAMETAGIEVVEASVGDRYVLEEMIRTGAVLGGEQSGHIIFSEDATTGDGILTAVRFLSLATKRGCSVSELAACMRRYPQVIVNVPASRGPTLDAADGVWRAVAAAEEALGEDGRVLVRASGTEPLVRVMVEASSEEEARRHADAVAAAARLALG